MSSRQGATGGCCTFQPLLHAEGSQGWSSSRRREIFLRGGELSTKGNPEQVNGSRTRSAPSATAGCPKHPSQHPSCEVGFQLRSSSLCKKNPSVFPQNSPWAGGKQEERATGAQKHEEIRKRPSHGRWDRTRAWKKAQRRALLPHPETIWGSPASVLLPP